MILVVSLNPAVDKYLRLDRLRLGDYQQVQEVVTSAGGKGINVAGVIRELGEEVVLLGFFGGYTGDFLLAELEKEGVQAVAVRVTPPTRVAFVVVEEAEGRETEIVEPGAAFTPAELGRLRAQLARYSREARMVVLSGSVPVDADADIYAQLLADCAPAAPALLDTGYPWLGAGLRGPRPPDFIKPNRREARQLLGRELAAPADFHAALDRLAGDVASPLISDGPRGLYARHAGIGWHACPPALEVVNSVGSGDAAVAGLAVGLARGLEFSAALRLATACGAANVLTKECAQVRRADVERLLPQVELKQYSE